MPKKLFFLALMFSFVIYSCKDSSLSDKNTEAIEPNTISGTVTFAGENFVPGTEGAYQVAAFEHWPPIGRPSASAVLNIRKEGNVYKADYKLHNLGVYLSGNYIVAVGWVNKNYRTASPVLGIYSCDTSRYENCNSSNSWVRIEDNKGIGKVNIICWADTSKKINVPY